jgi:hypothetical protein
MAAAHEATSPSEAEVLKKLDDLPTAQARTVGPLNVVADAPYDAASGKMCRRVLLTQAGAPKRSKTRLACRGESEWAFVPSVFLAPEGN